MQPMFSVMTEISGKVGEKRGSHKRRRWNILETGAICGEEGEKQPRKIGSDDEKSLENAFISRCQIIKVILFSKG